jgi:hypothetical protein
MQKNLKLYVVLSYLLIPISLIFAFLDIALLISALANPSTLIMVFIIACLVIYTFVSFKFLKLGIQREQPQSNKLKDWIKLNAYVSLFLCAVFFINSISILVSTNATLQVFIDEFLQQQPTLPTELNSAFILTLLKGLAVFLLVVSSVGLLHIRTTLRLVKEYDYLFE